jgi:DNA invertase Pin-like site-specific DNA recombinase
MSKINDLSKSNLRKRFFDNDFVAENKYTIGSIRVSTKKQESGQSIEEQLEIINNYVKKEGLILEKIYKVSETAAKHEVRKHFHEMIGEIKTSQSSQRPIKHIVFSHQSRSNRNAKSARQLEDIVDLGVALHFARDNRKFTCKSDIAESMMWHMENIRNESFIHELTKNTMGGTIKCIERGMFPGRPPFGYVSKGKKEDRCFKFDGEKAEYMKKAFELMTTKHYSDHRLKSTLDDLFPNIESTPDKKKFCELLRNPFYYGDFKYADNVYKGAVKNHPPLISKALWLEVQEVLTNRHRTRQTSIFHAYQGLMKCSGRILNEEDSLTEEVCGCAITAEKIRKNYKNGKTKEFNYYRCSNSTRKCSQRNLDYMKKVSNHKVSYNQDEIEMIFKDIFKSFSFDEFTVENMKKLLWDEHFEEKIKHDARRSDLVTRQSLLEKFISQSYEDKLSGQISEELWNRNNNLWEKERNEILLEMKSIGDEKADYMHRGVELIELMQHSEMIYEFANPEKKRKMIEIVSSNLNLCNGSIEFKTKKPFDLLCKSKGFENWYTHGDSNPGYRREKAMS